MNQPEFHQIKIERDFSDHNFIKRKIECLGEGDGKDLGERKKICTEATNQHSTHIKMECMEDREGNKLEEIKKICTQLNSSSVPHERKNLDIPNVVVKPDPCDNKINEDIKNGTRRKPAKHSEPDKRTPFEEIDALVQKLGWTGDVKQVCRGKKTNQNFAVCHHCQTLMIGGRDKIKRHIITHYNNEILEMFPSGKDCSICKKTFRYPAELAFHYAVAHSIAKEVIPKEYMHIKNVPEFLKFENSPVVDILVERLGWYEEVQQFDLGGIRNCNVNFIVCQHCPKLLVGRVWQLKIHMIKHYSTEILKNFPNNDKCGICEIKFNACYPSSIVIHYAMKHGLADKVVPKEDLQFTLVSEVLQDDSERKLLQDEQNRARALKMERRERARAEKSGLNVGLEGDAVSSDDEHGVTEEDGDSIIIEHDPEPVKSEHKNPPGVRLMQGIAKNDGEL